MHVTHCWIFDLLETRQLGLKDVEASVTFPPVSHSSIIQQLMQAYASAACTTHVRLGWVTRRKCGESVEKVWNREPGVLE